MDIARPGYRAQEENPPDHLYRGGLWLCLLMTIGVSRLKPAAPVVERTTVWLDSVHRGEMLREVRGLGTLVPVDIRWIPAQTSARVEKVVLQSGSNVKPDSVILGLSDIQLQRDALDAEYAYKAAQADLANLKVQLANNLMGQKSAAADVRISTSRPSCRRMWTNNSSIRDSNPMLSRRNPRLQQSSWPLSKNLFRSNSR